MSDCVPVHTTLVRPDGALHWGKIEIYSGRGTGSVRCEE